ncbi:uncharacterized protein LOC143913877 [Arctopsyche grandis]|uniref:uncharacterized protein LOC143913877 n=1 Tax=Arctopsyche grandis TaxID=121162 RepID=UPI00406D8BDB
MVKINTAHLKLVLWCIFINTQVSTSAHIPENETSTEKQKSDNSRQTQYDDSLLFQNNDDDGITLEKLIIDNYSKNDTICLSQNKFFVDGKCHSLASQGPCPIGEWLVLDKNADYSRVELPIRPICKAKPCTERNEIWWPDQNKCLQKSLIKSQYCQSSFKEVTSKPFGEGSCTCIDNFGIFENGNQCHEYYHRGPCKNSEVVTYNQYSGYAVCTVDKCLVENRKSLSRRSIVDYPLKDPHHVGLNKNTNKNVVTEKDSEYVFVVKRSKRAGGEKEIYAPMIDDDKCYKLGSSDPCVTYGLQSRFIVDQVSHVPTCSTMNSQLNLIDAPLICHLDNITGECRKSARIQQRGSIAFHLKLGRSSYKKSSTHLDQKTAAV